MSDREFIVWTMAKKPPYEGRTHYVSTKEEAEQAVRDLNTSEQYAGYFEGPLYEEDLQNNNRDDRGI